MIPTIFAEVVKLLKEISCGKSITHIFVHFVRSQNTNPYDINTSPVPVRSQRVGLTRIPLTTTAILSRARKRGSDYFMELSLTISRRLTGLYHVLSIMNDYKIVGGQTWYKTYELNVHILRRVVPNTHSSTRAYDSKNSFKAIIYLMSIIGTSFT